MIYSMIQSLRERRIMEHRYSHRSALIEEQLTTEEKSARSHSLITYNPAEKLVTYDVKMYMQDYEKTSHHSGNFGN
jgi:hypothetical protein